MSDTIDYYFTAPSPFAYLGHKALNEIATKHNKKIHYRPVNIMALWSESGAVPPGQRPVVRQRYREIELQRVAHFRNTCLNVNPKFFPTDPTLADLTICALVNLDLDAGEFAHAVGRAIWEREMQLADEATLSTLLDECGHDAAQILAVANSEAAETIRKENTSMAVAADAVGAPAYVYKGEVFWGQDRLDHLDHMISTDRKAFGSNIS
jgi:2-hydroxychromene-2-carboxylate isomerase